MIYTPHECPVFKDRAGRKCSACLGSDGPGTRSAALLRPHCSWDSIPYQQPQEETAWGGGKRPGAGVAAAGADAPARPLPPQGDQGFPGLFLTAPMDRPAPGGQHSLATHKGNGNHVRPHQPRALPPVAAGGYMFLSHGPHKAPISTFPTRWATNPSQNTQHESQENVLTVFSRTRHAWLLGDAGEHWTEGERAVCHSARCAEGPAPSRASHAKATWLTSPLRGDAHGGTTVEAQPHRRQTPFHGTSKSTENFGAKSRRGTQSRPGKPARTGKDTHILHRGTLDSTSFLLKWNQNEVS